MLAGHRLADLLTPLLDSSATDIHAVGSVALREQRLRQAVLARRQGCSELRIPSPLFLSEPKSAAPGGTMASIPAVCGCPTLRSAPSVI